MYTILENSYRNIIVDVDITNSIIVQDFEIEDMRVIWGTIKGRSVFNGSYPNSAGVGEGRGEGGGEKVSA